MLANLEPHEFDERLAHYYAENSIEQTETKSNQDAAESKGFVLSRLGLSNGNSG